MSACFRWQFLSRGIPWHAMSKYSELLSIPTLRQPTASAAASVEPATPRTRAPIVDRLHSLWESMREPVVAAFPTAPGLPKDTDAYLSCVDEMYRSDAYLASLERASVNHDMEPFARFLAERVQLALKRADGNS